MLEVRKVAGVEDAADKLFDHVLTPVVPLDAAARPERDAAVAAPPTLTTSPEYVYLLRMVLLPLTQPNAKIPTVLLPVAEPLLEAAVAAPPALTTSPE
jgi:hypothetical protein